MAILKSKDIAKMSGNEINDKLKELKMEFVKTKVGVKKASYGPRAIKRTIAKLLTFNRMNELKKIKIKEEKPVKKQINTNKKEVKKQNVS